MEGVNVATNLDEVYLPEFMEFFSKMKPLEQEILSGIAAMVEPLHRDGHFYAINPADFKSLAGDENWIETFYKFTRALEPLYLEVGGVWLAINWYILFADYEQQTLHVEPASAIKPYLLHLKQVMATKSP
jgi:hypothetical protein